MLEILVVIFFGWPAILVTIVFSLIGLFKYNYRLLVSAAILAFGPFWFLSGFPVVHSPVFLAPVLLFSAAFFESRGREMLAWLLAIPYYLVVILVLLAAVTQP
jgi:hypothetical protein